MQQYKWVAGSDPAGSPVFEMLSESDTPMSVEELVAATGEDLETVKAHLQYGIQNGLVRAVTAEAARPALRPMVGPPPAPPAPKREGKIASEAEMMEALAGGKPAAEPKEPEKEASMTDWLLGSKRTSAAEDEASIARELGRNVL